MDQLEAWRVRGRVATAIKNLRDSLVCVTTATQELNDAMAEAQSVGLHEEAPAAAGATLGQ